MSNEILLNTAVEHLKELDKGAYSAVELASACLDRANETSDYNIFLNLDNEKILKQAEESDKRRKSGKKGLLEGIPVAIKDNICVLNEKTTCASRILQNFVSPYNATIIEKLKAEGAILFGRTNMDEFAMGSSTENSAYMVTKNPWNPDYVPGGSSGGSAAAVASLTVPLSLGSDTGGSIRQPASLCGIVGVKPTYGRVSRYGLVAFASSLDQIGPFSKTVEDSSLLLAAINGHDAKDSTSHVVSEKNRINTSVSPLKKSEWNNIRVGISIPKENEKGYDPSVIHALQKSIEWLRSQGAQIVELKSQYWNYAIPVYYILATAEASSNLMRYDGIRYGRRTENPADLTDLYIKSRTEGFGTEVKRRILLGTYVLSSGYFDAYYKSAQKARKLIQKEYSEFFQNVDVILQATSPTTAFRIGERNLDPVAMYQSDLLTISANLGGVPSLSIPAGTDKKGLPVGIQLTGNYFEENKLFRIASSMSDIDGFGMNYSEIYAKQSGNNIKNKNKNQRSDDAENQKNKKKYNLASNKKTIEKKADNIFNNELIPDNRFFENESAIKEAKMENFESLSGMLTAAPKKTVKKKSSKKKASKKKAVKKAVKKKAGKKKAGKKKAGKKKAGKKKAGKKKAGKKKAGKKKAGKKKAGKKKAGKKKAGKKKAKKRR